MTIKLKNYALLLCAALLICINSATIANAQKRNPPNRLKSTTTQTFAEDFHSYSNPQMVRVRHVDLDWTVLFDKKILRGAATLTIERAASAARNAPLILDTRDLRIEKVEASINGRNYKPAKFDLGAADKILGAPLTIQIPANAGFVRIFYSTSPTASGLQWLEPSQTAGKKTPYMFSQAQAIHARSFIPLQD